MVLGFQGVRQSKGKLWLYRGSRGQRTREIEEVIQEIDDSIKKTAFLSAQALC